MEYDANYLDDRTGRPSRKDQGRGKPQRRWQPGEAEMDPDAVDRPTREPDPRERRDDGGHRGREAAQAVHESVRDGLHNHL